MTDDGNMASYYLEQDLGAPEPTWKCRDGSVVRIADMSDRHLVNTIRMLRRNRFAYELVAIEQIGRQYEEAGDAAQEGIDEFVRDLADADGDDALEMISDVFTDLLNEAERRKLEIKP